MFASSKAPMFEINSRCLLLICLSTNRRGLFNRAHASSAPDRRASRYSLWFSSKPFSFECWSRAETTLGRQLTWNILFYGFHKGRVENAPHRVHIFRIVRMTEGGKVNLVYIFWDGFKACFVPPEHTAWRSFNTLGLWNTQNFYVVVVITDARFDIKSLLVKNRSKMFLPCVGSSTICCSLWSSKIAIRALLCAGYLPDGLKQFTDQSIPGRLKSPSNQMLCWTAILSSEALIFST